TAVLTAVVDVAASSPAREERGSHRLETDLRRDQRVLAELLGSDQQASAVDGGWRQHRRFRYPDRVATHQVEGAQVLDLVLVQPKVFALAEAIGYHAMGLDPVAADGHRLGLDRYSWTLGEQRHAPSPLISLR